MCVGSVDMVVEFFMWVGILLEFSVCCEEVSSRCVCMLSFIYMYKIVFGSSGDFVWLYWFV